jgi:hypothetical protein
MSPLNPILPRGKRVGISVPTTLTLLRRIEFQDARQLSVEVKNVGGQNFNAFAVKLVPHPEGGSYTVADAQAEFADATLIGCVLPDGTVANPVVLAATNGACLLTIARNGAYAAEVYASVAASTSIAELRWNGGP